LFFTKREWLEPEPGNTKGGKHHCTIDLLFDWFGISCMTADIFFTKQAKPNPSKPEVNGTVIIPHLVFLA
jgi:hypothetical protein